ncbi:hypothetical protein A2U01_0067938, partial [Trifolium medium]|nr:hypothetical protein [Trifolium medium]
MELFDFSLRGGQDSWRVQVARSAVHLARGTVGQLETARGTVDLAYSAADLT